MVSLQLHNLVSVSTAAARAAALFICGAEKSNNSLQKPYLADCQEFAHSFTLFHFFAKRVSCKSLIFNLLRTLQIRVIRQLPYYQWLPHSLRKHRGGG